MSPEQTQTPPGSGLPENHPAGFSTTLTDTTLSEALITLRKRRWVLIIAFILGVAYGLYKALSQPVIYEAAGRIQCAPAHRTSTVLPQWVEMQTSHPS